MLKILDKLPTETAADMQVVSFSRKATDKQPVTEPMKFRCVVAPSFSYTVVADPKEAETIFADALAEVVNAAASDILKDYCVQNVKDGNYPAEIPDEMLTFSAVLTRMVESQTSERLNGEQIGAWYDASATKEEAATRYGAEASGLKKQAALRTKYLAIASNNPGIDPQLATKMLGYIAEKDTASPVCRAVAKKLERLTKVTVDADEL